MLPVSMAPQVFHAARHPWGDPTWLKYFYSLPAFITSNGTLSYIFPFILPYFFAGEDMPEALSTLIQPLLSTFSQRKNFHKLG